MCIAIYYRNKKLIVYDINYCLFEYIFFFKCIFNIIIFVLLKQIM